MNLRVRIVHVLSDILPPCAKRKREEAGTLPGLAPSLRRPLLQEGAAFVSCLGLTPLGGF